MTDGSPNLKTFDEVVPMIYSWTTPSVIAPGHSSSLKDEGWEKIGYTEGSVNARIAQQASQMGSLVEKQKLWAYKARFITEGGGWFTDHDFHKYLRQQGVKRFVDQGKTEWHHFVGTPKTSDEYFSAYIKQDFASAPAVEPQDYTLRPEQEQAVEQALTAFGPSVDGNEVLWNAKPRFGKTLTTYHLMRKLDVKRALIVTNRPAIANSWYDDFERFVAHCTTYQFVSDSPSLDKRSPMTRDQWKAYSLEHQEMDPRLIEFVSLQDLKGSLYFGGAFDKLKYIADTQWDLLVIDEAHEGIDTSKTHVAFDRIKRTRTLHLSGTPFRALAEGRFSQNRIFNWTYQDEQAAKAQWSDETLDNPYAQLPTLNLLTYQLSRMVTDRLAEGVALDEQSSNVDYTFNLAEFFATKNNGYFLYESDVERFLDALTTQEKYPFSSVELRNEVRHSFWLLNRVASARALKRLLEKHPVFGDYTIILAAGDGRPSADSGDLDEAVDDLVTAGKSLDKVREAIAKAEVAGGKTITLSVGQLTTGVTVPEWTAVIMLSNLSSPSLYMQAAFRSQNPCTFIRGDKVYTKRNAYIFDFAPERTLTVFDQFANDLAPRPPVDDSERRENIRRLLNFFPILGEDTEGQMIELDAEKVLTFPQVFKAREVVRRGFLSNLLFANVSGIFRAVEHFEDILNKLPVAKEKRVEKGKPVGVPVPPPITDADGNVQVDFATVINPKVAEIGKPIYSNEDLPALDPTSVKADQAAKQIAVAVNEKARETREKLAAEYGLSDKQVAADEKATESQIQARVERALIDHKIALNHIEAEAGVAATEIEFQFVVARKADAKADLDAQVLAILHDTLDNVTENVVRREETKKAQKSVNRTLDSARDHLRGFARTIPMFLMAYGDRDMRLSNFEGYPPDGVFAEIAGITEDDFRKLRDGREVCDPTTGGVTRVPGLFDQAVFDRAIQEFLGKKTELADYFDPRLTEDIFAYIPEQKTSLVFTPKPVVQMMLDTLEAENPGIFSDPAKTFADLFSTAGLFCMELVRRLDAGLAGVIPDPAKRRKHIFTEQVFEMSHNRILHQITLEAVSGGVPERRAWLEDSGHFRVGDLSKMTTEEREALVHEMLGGD